MQLLKQIQQWRHRRREQQQIHQRMVERMSLMKKIREAKYRGIQYQLEREQEGTKAWAIKRKVQLKSGYARPVSKEGY